MSRSLVMQFGHEGEREKEKEIVTLCVCCVCMNVDGNLNENEFIEGSKPMRPTADHLTAFLCNKKCVVSVCVCLCVCKRVPRPIVCVIHSLRAAWMLRMSDVCNENEHYEVHCIYTASVRPLMTVQLRDAVSVSCLLLVNCCCCLLPVSTTSRTKLLLNVSVGLIQCYTSTFLQFSFPKHSAVACALCVCVFVIAKAIAHDGFHNANSSGTIY